MYIWARVFLADYKIINRQSYHEWRNSFNYVSTQIRKREAYRRDRKTPPAPCCLKMNLLDLWLWEEIRVTQASGISDRNNEDIIHQVTLSPWEEMSIQVTQPHSQSFQTKSLGSGLKFLNLEESKVPEELFRASVPHKVMGVKLRP